MIYLNACKRKDQNIVCVVGLVGTILQKINDIRQHDWDKLYEEAKNFCVKQNIIVPKMDDEITKRGRTRGHGGQLVTYCHHFSKG